MRSCGLTWAVETQRQWSERSHRMDVGTRGPPPRSLAHQGLKNAIQRGDAGSGYPDRTAWRHGAAHPLAAWYDKTSPSFADAIALVRRHLWVQQGTFMPSEREHESIKVPRLLYHRMLDSLAYAA